MRRESGSFEQSERLSHEANALRTDAHRVRELFRREARDGRGDAAGRTATARVRRHDRVVDAVRVGSAH